jgi:hypothetical protein
VTTSKVALPRAVGEVVAEPVGLEGLDTLTGFENHGGRTTLGEGAQPLARVVSGVGNGDGAEGAVAGRVLGTYLHGPVLARNPALADLLLSWALDGETLAPLDDRAAESLRLERLEAARTRRFGRRRSVLFKGAGSPDPGDEAGGAGPVGVVAQKLDPEQALLDGDAVHIGGTDQGGDAGHDGRAP